MPLYNPVKNQSIESTGAATKNETLLCMPPPPADTVMLCRSVFVLQCWFSAHSLPYFGKSSTVCFCTLSIHQGPGQGQGPVCIVVPCLFVPPNLKKEMAASMRLHQLQLHINKDFPIAHNNGSVNRQAVAVIK